ncbi:unnamed protein product [Echinostoma caproni]|uniref:Protein kinase domain-containing protein n=1 Tax=Echinostoma caproni TaxID=27848 RepID=A0A183AE52_9TREM|nr:unnamed protein product [Echinostoma caproni]
MYNGDIKITDFGTSKRLIGLDPRARTVAGTMRYMAPELVVGRRGYGYPVDIWSFGCTVVEMLTAAVPFVELDNALAAFYTVGRDKTHPTIPPTVSPTCHNFLMRTFAANPDERATAGQLLLDEFIEMHRKTKRRPKGKTARTPGFHICLNPQLRIESDTSTGTINHCRSGVQAAQHTYPGSIS